MKTKKQIQAEIEDLVKLKENYADDKFSWALIQSQIDALEWVSGFEYEIKVKQDA